MRMHEAVGDAVAEIRRRKKWFRVADAGESADIRVEIKAYALRPHEHAYPPTTWPRASPAAVEVLDHHYIYAEVRGLGIAREIVGKDERRHATRERAVSHLVGQLQDYCEENYQKLDSRRR